MRLRPFSRRRPRPEASLPWLVAAALPIWVGLAVRPARADYERTFSYKSDEITVTSLVGSMRVEKGSGDEIKVLVNVRGEDSDPKWIQFDEQKGNSAELDIRFPVEAHRRYVYPKLGSGSRSSFTLHDARHGEDNWFEEMLDLASGDRIEVRGSPFGSAIELWADVVIQVPASKMARARLGVGQVDANGVQGDLELRVKSGAITADDIRGDLLADTGSGRVTVNHVEGELSVDTGSGGVDVADVSGGKSVLVDTGSGSVDVRRVKAEKLSIDTGSGGVDVSEVEVQDLLIDTGSGSVEGDELGADDLRIDTGSGGVRLDLVRMGKGRYDVETGSGGIRLDLPREISAEFDVETGSGGIDADIEGVTLSRRQRREAHFTVGGGAAQVTLSTGSGGVQITQGRGMSQR